MWRRVWIWERKLKKGVTYCLRWHDERGRIRTETVGTDRKLAERLRSQREVELNEGRLEHVQRISFEEFAKEELQVMRGRLAEGTLDIIERSLREFKRLVDPGAVADITPKMVEEFLSKRLQEVSRASANKNLRTLKACLNRAKKRGYLVKNPAAEVKQVREPEKTIRALSGEEIEKLLDACPSLWWKAFISVAVTTGMRRGELLALRWKDVDLESGTVWVRNYSGHTTKSRKNRVLALLPEVCGLVDRLERRGPQIFVREDGSSMDSTLNQEFAKIVKRAGIEWCTPHDLRRTFVTQLAAAGVNEAVVQKLAGHASIDTTVKHYTGVMPATLRAAQMRLSLGKYVSDTYHPESEEDEKKDGKIIKLSRYVG